jgi:hypothetical protein
MDLGNLLLVAHIVHDRARLCVADPEFLLCQLFVAGGNRWVTGLP